ncbi:hypothetical protein EDC04DRAFT_2897293 [Pisolithus marmoratus]|nr:hypothetical protein EDC04DRAFT_2897293 [Pisolithus marmoratus]
MSDEYTNDGMRDSRVLDTSRDVTTGNYPPQGDTTSSGGYGATNTFSPRVQRGIDTFAHADHSAGGATAVQQSTTGTDLRGQVQDAQQGVDRDAREAFQECSGGQSQGGNDGESLDNRDEAEAALRDRYTLGV